MSAQTQSWKSLYETITTAASPTVEPEPLISKLAGRFALAKECWALYFNTDPEGTKNQQARLQAAAKTLRQLIDDLRCFGLTSQQQVDDYSSLVCSLIDESIQRAMQESGMIRTGEGFGAAERDRDRPKGEARSSCIIERGSKGWARRGAGWR